jgi:hypothetical protein
MASVMASLSHARVEANLKFIDVLVSLYLPLYQIHAGFFHRYFLSRIRCNVKRGLSRENCGRNGWATSYDGKTCISALPTPGVAHT